MGRKGKGGGGGRARWGRSEKASSATGAEKLPPDVRAVELDAKPFAPPSRLLLYALAAAQDVRERTVFVDGSKNDPTAKVEKVCPASVEKCEPSGVDGWVVALSSKELAAKAVRELSSTSWRGMRLSFPAPGGLVIQRAGAGRKKEQQQQQQQRQQQHHQQQQQQQQQRRQQRQQWQQREEELEPLPEGRFEGKVCTLRQSFGYLKATVKGYGRANRDSRFFFPAEEVALLCVSVTFTCVALLCVRTHPSRAPQNCGIRRKQTRRSRLIRARARSGGWGRGQSRAPAVRVKPRAERGRGKGGAAGERWRWRWQKGGQRGQGKGGWPPSV